MVSRILTSKGLLKTPATTALAPPRKNSILNLKEFVLELDKYSSNFYNGDFTTLNMFNENIERKFSCQTICIYPRYISWHSLIIENPLFHSVSESAVILNGAIINNTRILDDIKMFF